MSCPIITTSEGKLQGIVRTTTEGFKFNSYTGIPYAKPPIGNLRFRDPELPEKWSEILDATKQGDISAQFNVYSKSFIGVEDSLFLNVYVPSSATSQSNLPVLCYIHGGGFYIGDGTYNLLRTDNLVQQDIIVVTMNYRLGMLGFLCLHTPEVPGNAGLKDQVFALRWVQKNIKSFGGDPGNVTIMGESAGSACVHYHMMSPMSKGLFGRAIMQSGSCISEWAKQKDPELHAFEIAEKLGLKKTIDKEEMLNFLRKVPVQDLVTAARVDFTYDLDIWFCGIVENKFPNCEAFLVDDPINLMKSGNYNAVPNIHGIVSHEALLFYNQDIIEAVEKDEFFIPLNKLKDIIYINTMCNLSYEDLKKIHYFYFKNESNPVPGYINLISDLFFVKDAARAVKLLKNHCKKVYYYLLAYGGQVNIVPPSPLYDYDGAGHCDDNKYLFKKEEDSFILNPADSKTRKQLVGMWTNFVKCGNPTPEINDVINTVWEPVEDDQLYALKIKGDLSMIKDPFSERTEFLEEILAKYN